MSSDILGKLSGLRINALALVNTAFLLIAPFLSWLTLNLFGTHESNLWEISKYQAPMQISQTLAFASLISGILLIFGALIALKWVRVAVLIETAGFLLFLISSYSLFGYVRNGLILFLISPGIGLILSAVGIVIGVISIGGERIPLDLAIKYLAASDGLYKAGLFIAATAIMIDGFNHAALGQIQGFFGEGLVEEFIHMGFLIPLLVLAGAESIPKKFNLGRWKSRIVVIGFIFLAEDAAYHFFGGTVLSFLGHTSAELFLHLAAYYGIALLIISRFLLKK